MPLDALQQEILDEARHKANEIDARARDEAGAIMKEAKARAKGIEDAYDRELKEEIGRLGREYQSNREMLERNITVSAKEHYAEALLARLKGSVAKRIREKGYKKIFDAAMKEALQISPAAELTVVISKQDEKLVKVPKVKIRNQKIDGLIVYADDGKIKIDATLGTLFERNKDAIREALIKGAFGSGKSTEKKKKKSTVRKARKRKAKPKPRRRK